MADAATSSQNFHCRALVDQKIAEHLHLLRRLQLFGIDEIDRHGRQLRFLQHRHQVAFVSGQIIGNETDADAGADRIFHGDDAVGGERRPARRLAVEPGGLQPADGGQMRRRRAAVGDDRVVIDGVDDCGAPKRRMYCEEA